MSTHAARRVGSARSVGPVALATVVALLLAVVALASHGGLHGSLVTHAGLRRLAHAESRATLRTRAPGPAPGVDGAGRPRSTPRAGSGTPVPSWLAIAALVVLAGAVLASIAVRFRERRRFAGDAVPAAPTDPEPTGGGAPREALRAAVERSLAEVQADPNPRRAIIGAYRLMELTLARAGFARGSAEAPREYLARTLASLELGPEPPRRLTALFERARFDRAELDLELRDEAVGALLALRSEL